MTGSAGLTMVAWVGRGGGEVHGLRGAAGARCERGRDRPLGTHAALYDQVAQKDGRVGVCK